MGGSRSGSFVRDLFRTVTDALRGAPTSEHAPPAAATSPAGRAGNDGRGKDRPVLIIGRQDATHVYAVKLTSKSHDGDRDFLPLGTGAWDPAGRASWVDVDQLYSVPVDGVRREASALDIDRFTTVARALQVRYGWDAGS